MKKSDFVSTGQRLTHFSILKQGIQSKHPVLLSAVLGAGGGIGGAVVAAILMLVIGLVFEEALTGFSDSSGFAEGLGYLIGFYCLFMFPWGGAILGAVVGAITGALRIAWARELIILPLLLAGFLTVVILSLATFVGMFIFFG